MGGCNGLALSKLMYDTMIPFPFFFFLSSLSYFLLLVVNGSLNGKVYPL